MIYRLDLAREIGATAGRADAPCQLIWSTLGVAGVLRWCCWSSGTTGCCPATPTRWPWSACSSRHPGGAAGEPVGGQRRPDLDPARRLLHPAGRFAKIALIIFAAAFLVSKRDVLALASRKVAGLVLPGGRDLGPLLVAWILSILVWCSSATWAPRCCSSAPSW